MICIFLDKHKNKMHLFFKTDLHNWDDKTLGWICNSPFWWMISSLGWICTVHIILCNLIYWWDLNVRRYGWGRVITHCYPNVPGWRCNVLGCDSVRACVCVSWVDPECFILRGALEKNLSQLNPILDVNRNRNVMRVKVFDRTGLGSSEHRCAQNCREWTDVECTVYAYSTLSLYGSKDHLPSVRLVSDLWSYSPPLPQINVLLITESPCFGMEYQE